MTRLLGSYRLLPIVLLAAAALFVLKSTGIVLDGGYTLGERMALREAQTMTVTVPASPSKPLKSPSQPLKLAGGEPKRSWMQEVFNYPDPSAPATGRRPAGPDRPVGVRTAVRPLEPIVTGSIGTDEAQSRNEGGNGHKIEGGAAQPVGQLAPPDIRPPEPRREPADPPPTPDGRLIQIEPQGMPSASERALLQRLQERRQELEARGRELDLREAMIEAAEKRLKATLTEIKATEERIAATVQQRDEAEAKRFKGIVTMYEAMKPRDAAKIFDRLDQRVLLEVAGQINPRRMSDIMAQMNPETAEKLTVDLATRATAQARSEDPANLPKIQGRPSGG